MYCDKNIYVKHYIVTSGKSTIQIQNKRRNIVTSCLRGNMSKIIAIFDTHPGGRENIQKLNLCQLKQTISIICEN